MKSPLGRLRLKNGGQMVVDWQNVAEVTALVLTNIPTEPPHKGTNLLGLPTDSESAYPGLQNALTSLRAVRAILWAYAKSGSVDARHADGKALVNALVALDGILTHRWALPEQHRNLPIYIASVARTVSVAGSMSAEGKRPNVDRRSALRKSIEGALKRESEISYAALLDQLQGDGAVNELRDGRVYHPAGDITLDRFESLVSLERSRLRRKRLR